MCFRGILYVKFNSAKYIEYILILIWRDNIISGKIYIAFIICYFEIVILMYGIERKREGGKV